MSAEENVQKGSREGGGERAEGGGERAEGRSFI